MVDFGGAQEGGVYADIFLPVEARVPEGRFHELANRVGHAGRNYIIVRGVLLEHEPHGPHVVSSKPPVTACFEVAQTEVAGQSELDAGYALGDLAGDELDAAAGRLVVEKNSRYGEQPVTLAIIHGDVMTEHLRHAVRAARVKRGELGLRHLPHAPVHLARRGLVQTDAGIDLPDRLEHASDALRVELAGQQRLVP